MRRIGAKKAAVAIAHDILIIAYHILRGGVAFEEREGPHPKQLDDLGFEASPTPKSA